jgi:PKD repeat protein
MGYTPEWCRTLFTTQQTGRMHCWTNDRLSGWISGVLVEAETTFGPAPLDVQFNAQSFRTVTSYQWDFGDQATATVQSPSHTYSQPGLYSVWTSVETTDGPFEDFATDLIWVYADTVVVDSAGLGPGDPMRVDISLINYLPLNEIVLPFAWSEENQLELDSISTAGLRTEAFEVQSLVDLDNGLRRGAIQLKPTAGGDGDPLSPGTSPVVSLYFSAPAGLPDTTTIDIAPYSYFTPLLIAPAGAYTPEIVSGTLYSATCCEGRVGNANGAGGDEPTIGDVTVLIDALFISEEPSVIPCLLEADINQSGGTDPQIEDISIGDISYLIDYMFVTGSSLGLPDCL